jgi:hypothetical protein
MGKPLSTTFTFRNGKGYLSISDNSVESEAVGESLAKALVELADLQLLEGRVFSPFEAAEFIKTSSGIDYEKTFG